MRAGYAFEAACEVLSLFSVVCVTTRCGEAPREAVSDKGAAAGSSNAAAADPVAKVRW